MTRRLTKWTNSRLKKAFILKASFSQIQYDKPFFFVTYGGKKYVKVFKPSLTFVSTAGAVVSVYSHARLTGKKTFPWTNTLAY
jgi:hypothetical protein